MIKKEKLKKDQTVSTGYLSFAFYNSYNLATILKIKKMKLPIPKSLLQLEIFSFGSVELIF